MNKKLFSLEKILFILINLFFSFSLLIFFLSEHFSFWLSTCLNNADPVSSEQDGYYISLIILFWLLYLILKIFTFIILYKSKNIFSYINQFLENFKRKNHFRKSVFKKAILLDISAYIITVLLCFILIKKPITDIFFFFLNTLILYICCGGGVTTSYSIFLLCLKTHSFLKKKKHLFYRAN